MKISKDQLRQIIAGAPPGSDPEEIVQGLLNEHHEIEGLPVRGGHQVERQLLSMLPPVGAALGGTLAGIAAAGGTVATGGANAPFAIPEAMAGAAAGGMAGKGIENTILRARGLEPESSLTGRMLNLQSPEANDIASTFQEGPVQAALEGGGLMAVAGGKHLAENTMRKALDVSQLVNKGMTTAEAKKMLADLALKYRVGPGNIKFPWPRMLGGPEPIEGSQAMKGILGKSGRVTRGLLKAAYQNGARFKAEDLVSDVKRLISDVGNQTFHEKDLARIDKMVKQFMKEWDGEISPMSVKELKRAAQNVAKGIIEGRKVEGAAAMGPKKTIAARFEDAIATSTKRALEEIPQHPPGKKWTFGQGVAQSEKRTSNLIDLNKAIKRSETSTSRVRMSPFGSVRWAGEATPDLAMSRPSASRLALGITNGPMQAIQRQTPRTFEQLMELLMNNADQEQQ